MATKRRRTLSLLLPLVTLLIAGLAMADDMARLRSQPLHVDAPGKGPRLAAGSYPDAAPMYHNGSTLVCSDCHVMHASQTHYYNPASPANGEEVPYSGGANLKLLKAGDPLDLCLTCHDNQGFAPDVVGTDANGLQERSAGFFGQPELLNPNGHDLGHGLPRDGGFGLCMRCHFSSGEDMKVTCIDCHSPHGNGIARNLQWASYPEGTPELGLFTDPTATGLDRYEAARVSYGTLDSPLLREASNICIDCHHVFTGQTYNDPNGDSFHERHPAYESERNSPNNIAQGAVRGSTAPGHWNAGVGSGFGATPRLRFMKTGATGFAAAQVVDATTNGVFCLSCHKAHGSDQAFGMAWVLQDGYSAPGCDQCHLTAGAP